MGGEQRNWEMREGLEKGQGGKEKREGGSMCVVETQFCGPRLIANQCVEMVA